MFAALADDAYLTPEEKKQYRKLKGNKDRTEEEEGLYKQLKSWKKGTKRDKKKGGKKKKEKKEEEEEEDKGLPIAEIAVEGQKALKSKLHLFSMKDDQVKETLKLLQGVWCRSEIPDIPTLEQLGKRSFSRCQTDEGVEAVMSMLTKFTWDSLVMNLSTEEYEVVFNSQNLRDQVRTKLQWSFAGDLAWQGFPSAYTLTRTLQDLISAVAKNEEEKIACWLQMHGIEQWTTEGASTASADRVFFMSEDDTRFKSQSLFGGGAEDEGPLCTPDFVFVDHNGDPTAVPMRLPGGVEVNVCVIEIKGLVYFDGLTPVGDWQKVARQVSNYVHKYKLVGTTLLLQRNGIGKTAVQTLLTKISSVDGEAGAASFAVSTYNSKTSILPQNQPNPFDCPVSDHENLRVEEIAFLTQQDEAAVNDLKMPEFLEKNCEATVLEMLLPS